MIKIIPNTPKTKKTQKPIYILTYNYMIGDSNGETTEDVRVSVDNPYLERYVKLLSKLKPTKGHWGIILNDSRLFEHFKEKQITKEEYCFLNRMMFEEYDEEGDESDEQYKFEIPKENEKYADEFHDGVRSGTEYSFLVFQGVDLIYVDEFGIEHKTRIK